MDIAARATSFEEIIRWRDGYRLEMGCQIIHDSIHSRARWTDEYHLLMDGVPVGYGSIAVGGPWKETPTVYEFYVVPHHRLHLFELFQTLLSASGAVTIEAQSNDPVASAMIHTFAGQVTGEAILFHDRVRTSHQIPGAIFREPTVKEAQDVPLDQLKWRGVIEIEGRVAATGGILFHYNRPYGDIYMEVMEPFRRRGLGSFLVQELKRVCYEGGHVPAARCNTKNIASRRTLQKAGFVPCGHLLKGVVQTDSGSPPHGEPG